MIRRRYRRVTEVDSDKNSIAKITKHAKCRTNRMRTSFLVLFRDVRDFRGRYFCGFDNNIFLDERRDITDINSIPPDDNSMLRTLAILLFVTTPLLAQDTAKKLYADQCTRCHGDKGQGTKKYPQALAGGKSVAQLADVIQKTMPESDPGSLTIEQAKSLATYIHAEFYGEIARERVKPARIDLARLTAKQYRHAVADVVGSFRNEVPLGDARGLQGNYFQGNMRGKPVLDRIDKEVRFDFGKESPAPGKIEPEQYSIQWTGCVIIPETGEYEFVIKTDHALRFWVNSLSKPLIDAAVKSGKDTDYRERITLVGGRAYPIKLDFIKGKQGVADNKKGEKPPLLPAMVSLNWVRPGGVLEVIPERHLSPTKMPETFLCTTKFPPDDRSFGWERGTTISKEWDAATTEAALDVATYVAAKVGDFTGAKDGDPKRVEKWKAFCSTFAERAFRRTLTSEQKAIIIDKQFQEAKSPELAVKRAVLLILKSPFFLYREVQGGSDASDTAARLSFALWDSIPDKALRLAAEKGQLNTKEQIAAQAERMLNDPRAKAKLREFLLTWLHCDQQKDLVKDAKRFPGFDAAVISDLRTSLELFLDDVLASPMADYRQLLLSNDVYLNHRLAKFYGAQVKPDEGFKKVILNADKRAGVLTHPYLMANFATGAESSPIHRGVFLARGVLGVSLRPPPEAVAPLSPDLHPSLTTRERVILQTKANACMTCHGVINPLGFTLENFDAVGKFREKDHDKAIDNSGSYKTHTGTTVKVNGARDLGKFIASSEEAHDAFAEQLFHHLVQQPVRAYGATTNDDLRKSFVKNEFNIRKLAVDIMVASALTPRMQDVKQDKK
ncbi:PA14 domain-containing protein [soil metagenome]